MLKLTYRFYYLLHMQCNNKPISYEKKKQKKKKDGKKTQTKTNSKQRSNNDNNMKKEAFEKLNLAVNIEK